MDQFSQMHIFFLISSVGFVILFILIAVLLFYLNRAAGTFSRILDKIEKDIDHIGDTTKELLEDVRNSMVFSFLFGGKKRRRKD
ncbi:MAG: DUF948 domain-containing protein [Patescibacteria group bacterium]